MPPEERTPLDALRARPGPGLAALLLGVLLGALTGLAVASDGKPRLAAAKKSTADDREGSPGLGRPGEAGSRIRAARPALKRLVEAQEEQGNRLRVAVARLSNGRPAVIGWDRERAWSAIKLPVVTAYLDWQQEEKKGEDGWSSIDAASQELIGRVLVESDNQATRQLVVQMIRGLGRRVAAERIQNVLSLGGVETNVPTDDDPDVPGSIAVGKTQWSVRDGLEYYRMFARGCLLKGNDLSQVLELMNEAVDPPKDEVWGINKSFPTEAVYTKGGDGIRPETRKMTMEQFTVVGRGRDALVIAAMVTMALPLDPGGLQQAPPFAPDVQKVYDEARRIIASVGRIVAGTVGQPADGPETLRPATGC